MFSTVEPQFATKILKVDTPMADLVNCSVDLIITFGPFVLIPSQQLLLKAPALRAFR
jgi:hypothetical protein